MFQRATRHRAKLRLALSGPSGAGKTESALRIATGIGGKIAVIDTEHGSASLYSDRFTFDVCEIHAPYTTEKYVEAITFAISAGYTTVVIDSMSHAWAGEGGLLEQVDEVQQRGGNKMVAWGPATKSQNLLVNTILKAPVHLIATLRSKQEYAIETDAKGKTTVKKLGMASVQREGFEYEFTIALDIGRDHYAMCSTAGKDRSQLFEGKAPRMLSEKDGEALRAWLDSGTDPVVAMDQLAATMRDAKGRGWTAHDFSTVLGRFGVAKATELPEDKRADALALFMGNPPDSANPNPNNTEAAAK